MAEHRIMKERLPFEVVDGEQVYVQKLEWRDDNGKLLRRGHRYVTESGALFRQTQLKYEEVPA